MVSHECVIWGPTDAVFDVVCILVSTGVQVQLQEKLLNQDMSTLKPDLPFLELLAEVVDSNRLSLASALSLTSEMEEVEKEREGLPHKSNALLMLEKWAVRGDATYGQLCQRLNNIALFTTPTSPQPPPPQTPPHPQALPPPQAPPSPQATSSRHIT